MIQETNNDNLKTVEDAIEYPVTNPNEYSIQEIPEPVQQETISATTNDGRTISIKISSDGASGGAQVINAGDASVSVNNNTARVEEGYEKQTKKHRMVIFVSTICICLLCLCGCCFLIGGVIAVCVRVYGNNDYYDYYDYGDCGGWSVDYGFCFNMSAVENDPEYKSRFTYFTDDVSSFTCRELLVTLDSSEYAYDAISMTEGDHCYFVDSWFDDYWNMEEFQEQFEVDNDYCSEECPRYTYYDCGDDTGKFHSMFQLVEYMCAKAY